MHLGVRRWLGVGGCFAVALACGSRSELLPGQLPAEGGTSAVLGGSPASAGTDSPTGGVVATGGGPVFAGTTSGGTTTGASAGTSGSTGSAGEAGSGGAPDCPDDAGPEVCNGLDDDCDGEIDEDLPLDIVDGPVAVRTDEGRTDEGSPFNCISCGWAWYPQLVMPQGELGVVWYLGINGGYEQPSAFFRRLSWELEPQGVVSSLGPQYWMSTLARGTTRSGAELLTFVERLEHTDKPSFGLLSNGFEQGASMTLEGCSTGGYGGLLTPLAPSLVACASGGVVHTFALDDAGTRVTARNHHELALPGETKADLVARPVAAFKGSSGLLAVPMRPGPPFTAEVLWTQAISADGAPLAEARRQELGGPKGLHLEGLFATPQGYLLFADERKSGEWPGGRFVVPLTSTGELNGDLAHYDQGLADFDEVKVLQVGDGFVVAEAIADGLRVEQLDETGAMVSSWQRPLNIYSQPALLFARGHLYVTFVEEPLFDGSENRVQVMRFSCAPKLSLSRREGLSP